MNFKKTLLITVSALTIIAFFMANIFFEIDFCGNFEGLYLLKEPNTGHYQLVDHLFVGNERTIVYGVDLKNSAFSISRRFFHDTVGVGDHLHLDWNPHDGSGLVSSYFSDGTILVTYLGRYLDNSDRVHGLFVGGGLPETVQQDSNHNMNNSGMTFFNGKRWYHIWCSVNEGVVSSVTGKGYTPSTWEFIGSSVEKRSETAVVLTSRHQLQFDDTVLGIDRRMSFAAGEKYLNLQIKITNTGKAPASFNYLYGDEPWVGFYGTSLGDVGWVADRIVPYEEIIDTAKYSWIGMVDSGNSVIGERNIYTNLANFLEWYGPERPNIAYFTNDMNKIPVNGRNIPLSSNERFLGVIWDRVLKPGESVLFRLAVGMALLPPQSQLPVKPLTKWK